MMDSAKLIYESDCVDEMVLNSYGENTVAFQELNLLGEEHQELLGITPEKVVVNQTKGNNFLVEYTGNLERLIQDQNVSLDEALDMIAEVNDIPKERIYIVADESCIKKINFVKAKESDINFLRK
mgnify:CR=1 FL=1